MEQNKRSQVNVGSVTHSTPHVHHFTCVCVKTQAIKMYTNVNLRRNWVTVLEVIREENMV